MSTLQIIVLAIIVAWIISAPAIARRQARKFKEKVRGVQALLEDGAYERAEEAMRRVVDRFRWPAGTRKVSQYLLGLTVMRRGRLQEALDIFLRLNKIGVQPYLRGPLELAFSEVYALLGEVDKARVYLDSARKHDIASTYPEPYLVARALLQLREGEFQRAASELAEAWPKVAAAPKDTSRPLVVLRAFASARSSDAAADGGLATLGPARYEPVAYLGAQWPELDQFMRAHLSA